MPEDFDDFEEVDDDDEFDTELARELAQELVEKNDLYQGEDED